MKKYDKVLLPHKLQKSIALSLQGLEIDFGPYTFSLTLQITSRKASKSYMKMVDNSFLGSSDEVRFLYS
jgi:hypothetical protein